MSIFDDCPYVRQPQAPADPSHGIDYDYYFQRARRERSRAALSLVMALFGRAAPTRDLPRGTVAGSAR